MIGFNVSQLLKSGVGTTRRVEVDELDDSLKADLGLVSPTRGSLRLLRTPDGILVTGALEHDIEDTCSRCLEPFVRHETLNIDEEFRPVVDVSTGIPLAESGDPDAFKLNSQHELDLDEAIRQYTILERPLNSLCREDCRGLCITCGANLNLGPCKCETGEDEGPRGTFGQLLAERIRQAGLMPEEE